MKISAKRLVKVSAKSNGRCFYCGDEVTEKTRTIDHIKPRFSDGSDEMENLVLSCLPCNKEKGHLLIEEYRYKVACRKQGFPWFNLEQRRFLLSIGCTGWEPNKHSFYGELISTNTEGMK